MGPSRLDHPTCPHRMPAVRMSAHAATLGFSASGLAIFGTNESDWHGPVRTRSRLPTRTWCPTYNHYHPNPISPTPRALHINPLSIFSGDRHLPTGVPESKTKKKHPWSYYISATRAEYSNFCSGSVGAFRSGLLSRRGKIFSPHVCRDGSPWSFSVNPRAHPHILSKHLAPTCFLGDFSCAELKLVLVPFYDSFSRVSCARTRFIFKK